MPPESLPIAWPACRPSYRAAVVCRLTALAPWAASLLAGGLLALAAPPHDLWPLGLVGLMPLWLAIRAVRPGVAFMLAWLAGVTALMLATPWWLGLLKDFARLGLAPSLGLMLVASAYQALVFGAWAGVLRLLQIRYRVNPLLAGPLLFAALESSLPFFFKMYLAITVWRAWPLTQAAEVGGPAAVSALLVLANLVLAELLLSRWRRLPVTSSVTIGAALFGLIVAGGFLRAAQVAALRTKAPVMQVGLIQPNFGVLSAQERQMHGDRYVKALQQTTAALAKAGAELIVWPESAWPYPLDRGLKHDFPAGHPWTLRQGFGGRLLFGTLSRTMGELPVYNSAVLLDQEGAMAGRYDKNTLLPFGEYIPLADFFPATAGRLRETMDHWPAITEGSSPPLLKDGVLRLGIAICSEDLAPRMPSADGEQAPNLLISLASNAWFGTSGAPLQHLALASFRAIEARRDLVRATNTGVSALVDPLGRVLAEGPLAVAGGDRSAVPLTMMADARLLEASAWPPLLRLAFPFCCALLVAGAALRKKISRTKPHSINPGQRSDASL